MAVVRMTGDLIGDIKEKGRKSFEERIGRALKRGRDYRDTHNMFQAVVDAWLEEQGLTEIAKSLPPSFYTEKSCIFVGTINKHSMSRQSIYRADDKLAFVLCAMVNPSSASDRNTSLEVNHPSLQHFVDHAASINEEVAYIREERETFLTTLDRLLINSRSLKHALDQWPQLIELVPTYAINRLNEVVERKKREKAEREEAEPINVDTLNMSLVIGKISARAEE